MFSNEIVNIETLSSLLFFDLFGFFCLISFLLLPYVSTSHVPLFFPYSVHSTSRKKEKICSYRVPVAHSLRMRQRAKLIPAIQGRLLEWLMILSFNNIRPLARLLPGASLLNSASPSAQHVASTLYSYFLFFFFFWKRRQILRDTENPRTKRPRLFVCSEMRADQHSGL